MKFVVRSVRPASTARFRPAAMRQTTWATGAVAIHHATVRAGVESSPAAPSPGRSDEKG